MIGPDSLVERRLKMVEAEMDGERIALAVESGTCYGFNRSATRIWDLLDTPRTVSEIVADLTERFDVDAELRARNAGAAARACRRRARRPARRRLTA